MNEMQTFGDINKTDCFDGSGVISTDRIWFIVIYPLRKHSAPLLLAWSVLSLPCSLTLMLLFTPSLPLISGSTASTEDHFTNYHKLHVGPPKKVFHLCVDTASHLQLPLISKRETHDMPSEQENKFCQVLWSL